MSDSSETNTGEPVLALVADAQVDLSPLTKRLWAEHIPHRVFSEQQQQLLYLADAGDLPRVKGWLEDWRNDSLDPHDLAPEIALSQQWLSLLQAPLTLIVGVLIVAVFLWMQTSNDWHRWLLAGESQWPQGRWLLQSYLEIGGWSFWRLSLLHFSFLHLLMNLLWWWVLARRIEQLDGKAALLLLLLVAGVSASAAQWWYAGPGFAGIAGINMALLAWISWRQKRFNLNYQLPGALLTVMVGWLLLTLLGDTLIPGLSGSFHGLHFAGLISGFLLAWIWPRGPAQRRATEITDDATL